MGFVSGETRWSIKRSVRQTGGSEREQNRTRWVVSSAYYYWHGGRRYRAGGRGSQGALWSWQGFFLYCMYDVKWLCLPQKLLFSVFPFFFSPLLVGLLFRWWSFWSHHHSWFSIAVEFSLMMSILCEHCENQWWVWLGFVRFWGQDQKLYLLLGDQQKEFQGCNISTEKLGRQIFFLLLLLLLLLFPFLLSLLKERGKTHSVPFSPNSWSWDEELVVLVLVSAFPWNGDVHTAVLEEKTAFPSLKSDFKSGAFFFP